MSSLDLTMENYRRVRRSLFPGTLVNGSNNDLQYWGLDYPSLRASHSLFPGTPMELTITYSTGSGLPSSDSLSFIVSRYTDGTKNIVCLHSCMFLSSNLYLCGF